MGEASYSTYLVHGILLAVLTPALVAAVGLESGFDVALYVFGAIAEIAASNMVLYVGFEIPIIRRLRGGPASPRRLSRDW